MLKLAVTIPPQSPNKYFKVGKNFKRAPQYVSTANTQTMTVSVNGSIAGSSTCTRGYVSTARSPRARHVHTQAAPRTAQQAAGYVCSIAVPAPAGLDTVLVTMSTAPLVIGPPPQQNASIGRQAQQVVQGGGYILSTNGPTGSQVFVVANATNNVNITLKGVAKWLMPLQTCLPAQSFGQKVPVAILDASFSTISGTNFQTLAPINNAIANPFSAQAVGSIAGATVSPAVIDGTQPVYLNIPAASGSGYASLTGTSAATASGVAGSSLPATILGYNSTSIAQQAAFVTTGFNNGNYVQVIDTVNRFPCGQIFTDSTNSDFETQGIAASANGKRLFVATGYNNTVDVFDFSTGTAQVVPTGLVFTNGLVYDGNSDAVVVNDPYPQGASITTAFSTMPQASSCTACSAAPIVISGGIPAIGDVYGMALSGGTLYFANTNYATLNSVPLGGGTASTISLFGSSPDPLGVAVANGTVFTTDITGNGGYLETAGATTAGYNVNMGGASGSVTNLVAFDGKTHVYVATNNGVDSFSTATNQFDGSTSGAGYCGGVNALALTSSGAAFFTSGGCPTFLQQFGSGSPIAINYLSPGGLVILPH